MAAQTQISAFISTPTRDRLERYAEAHGMKKAALVEAALLHHLQALEELPADLIIPPRLVVNPATAEQLARLVENPPPPTAAMIALLADASEQVDDD